MDWMKLKLETVYEGSGFRIVDRVREPVVKSFLALHPEITDLWFFDHDHET